MIKSLDRIGSAGALIAAGTPAADKTFEH